ncbi:hypothetical protein BC830DRAFT_1106042 [Chytriomyces sp. MP71]|nr:hypothetical protein BC830DRAFT_1106042 [Chytriomyces sp. MP71]
MPNDVSGSFELTEKVMVVETGAIGGTSNPDHPLAAAKQLAAMEKERSVGTPRYLLLGYLVAVCLCFLAAGIVVAVLPVPTQVLVPLISIYSVLLLVFMTATVYFTYIKPTECRHPLPLYVFASGLSNGLALNSLPGFLMATLSNDINKVSKSASLALSTTEFVLFGLGSSLIILYMFHVERTSPHFEEHRRLRAIISKNFGTFTVFTAFELWAAGCCGVSVNLVTLLALYGMHSGEISSSILAAELTGKVVVLGGLGYIAVGYFRRPNNSSSDAFRAQFQRTRA